ncbi:MAG: hypothetical protein GY913_27820 [Proteobacteria bacterium]|nr:hypothetical protein [Pseudomonadota bacterium]MCP4920721.1 hypothetical protein [Pseudomonadota bacterium]
MKPLPALATLGCVLATAIALEVGVMTLYDAPTPMLDKAVAYNAVAHTEPELVIFGTCLPEQIIQVDLLEEELGMTSYNLATPAGTSRLMYLVLKNHIPPDANVQAIVVPFGKRDLTKLMAPYESQVMEVASWDDLQQLAEWACEGDRECETEMVVRKASRGYRYRGYLANKFWTSIGSKPPIPGYILSPGAVLPPGAGTDAPPPDQPGQPGEGDHGPPDADRQRGDSDTDLRYLAAFLDLAKDRDIPVYLTPLPEQSQLETGRSNLDPALEAAIAEHGATVLEVGNIEGLHKGHFEDDVHLGPEGRKVVTRGIAAALKSSM